MFVKFKALVENETERRIKSPRSYNGGEYVSNAFKEVCVKEGIRRELIAPHNPQHNGVEKRKNRSIVGADRKILHEQGPPLSPW